MNDSGRKVLLVIEDGTEVTVTSSLVSEQLRLWSVPFVFGESPV